ncbi:MAG: hypothetical protein ACLQUY_18610 [Ktedonobacterales bacterium]
MPARSPAVRRRRRKSTAALQARMGQIGQARSLLGASRARPVRLILRKHGFLALVVPGTEAVVSARLGEHPYVRDVAYLEYNACGESIMPR